MPERLMYREHMTRAMGRLAAVLTATADFRTANAGKVAATTMPCPVCTTGVLSVSITGRRGHMMGTCNTPDCVRWIE